MKSSPEFPKGTRPFFSTARHTSAALGGSLGPGAPTVTSVAATRIRLLGQFLQDAGRADLAIAAENVAGLLEAAA